MNQVMIIGKVNWIGNDFLDVKINGTDTIIRSEIHFPISEYIEIDCVVGIKGHLELDEFQNLKLVCDKLTFLSNKHTNAE